MKQPLTGESIPWVDCLNAKLKRCAAARPDTGTVRVNDFPEDRLYTLLIGGEISPNAPPVPSGEVEPAVSAG
jgi:hypothetical protein